MKKILMVLVLASVICAGIAFADTPDGLGVGAIYNRWFAGYAGITAKLPGIPMFLGAGYFGGWGGGLFGVGVDFMFVHTPLVPDIWLHWYMGAGAHVNFGWAFILGVCRTLQ